MFFIARTHSFNNLVLAQIPNMLLGKAIAVIETTPAWTALQRHAKTCHLDGCCCKCLINKFGAWANRLPLPTSEESEVGSGSTWLWFQFNANGMLRWRCVACHNSSNGFREEKTGCALNGVQSIQLHNLLRHHQSTDHRIAANTFLGLQPAESMYRAPDRSLFKQVFVEFQKGVAPGQWGYTLPTGNVGKDKANLVLWCMSESIFDQKRELMRRATVFNLIRDERNARMHIRFRVAARKLIEASRCCRAAGFLGQSRNQRPDAIGIMEATIAVFKTFCTKYAGCPVGVVKPQFSESLFKHMLVILEAITIDSAENEVVSAKDINKLKPVDSKEILVIRDAAHCARRLLSRLFRADQALSYVFDFFAMIAKLIHWSPDLRTLYQECCQESITSAVSTKFMHLRAAKHRIETWLTPLSRAVLDPDGDCNV
jgi:hypothetical protein